MVIRKGQVMTYFLFVSRFLVGIEFLMSLFQKNKPPTSSSHWPLWHSLQWPLTTNKKLSPWEAETNWALSLLFHSVGGTTGQFSFRYSTPGQSGGTDRLSAHYNLHIIENDKSVIYPSLSTGHLLTLVLPLTDWQLLQSIILLTCAGG